MFDWKPESPETQITSKYFWVYWAVTIPLTATVIGVWRVWWGMEEKKYQEELRRAKQDLKIPVDYDEQEKAILDMRIRTRGREWVRPAVNSRGSYDVSIDEERRGSFM